MGQLLVALDVDDTAAAIRLADALGDIADGFKIGSRLFTTDGPRAIDALVTRSARVFLDLKFHDIPTTVAGAVGAAVKRGVWMLTVHAAGGTEMMRAAVDAARETAARVGVPCPLVVGVTVLTSLTRTSLAELGVDLSPVEQVVSLARLAARAGLAGVVASPLEIRSVRDTCGPDFVVVTPGIRVGPRGIGDDQARTMEPREASEAGADYLVVGRPITAASDPIAAAGRIKKQLRDW
jgi:orotidine-5'-phosphate decarboxylase